MIPWFWLAVLLCPVGAEGPVKDLNLGHKQRQFCNNLFPDRIDSSHNPWGEIHPNHGA